MLHLVDFIHADSPLFECDDRSIGQVLHSLSNVRSDPSSRGQSSPFGDGVERRGFSDQPFEPHSIDLVPLVEVYGSPGSPLNAGIEEPPGIFQISSFGEGEFHVSLEGAGHADEAVGFPDRMVPLPAFRDVWAGAEDNFAKPREGHAAPVAKFVDVCVDPRGRIRPATLRGLLHWTLLQIESAHVGKEE